MHYLNPICSWFYGYPLTPTERFTIRLFGFCKYENRHLYVTFCLIARAYVHLEVKFLRSVYQERVQAYHLASWLMLGSCQAFS
jgi:hypothetical protein